MSRMTCAVCGATASLDWVGLFDFCPGCKTSPFPEVVGHVVPFTPGERAIFASTRPVNDDPKPYYVPRRGDGMDGTPYRTSAPESGARLLPRPEFDHPRAHEGNRALVALRDDSLWDDGAPLVDRMSWQLGYFEADFGREALSDGLYSPEEIEHARRVLTRLAAVEDVAPFAPGGKTLLASTLTAPGRVRAVAVNPILAEFRADPWFADIRERAIGYLEVTLYDMGQDVIAWAWAPVHIEHATRVLKRIVAVYA